MKLLIIGAAGRTGRLLVEQALGHGHVVTAFARSTPVPFPARPDLRIVRGDATDFESVNAVMRGHTGVAVAIGRSVGSGSGVHEAAIASIVHAMAANDVARLCVMSAAGAFARNDARLSLGFRALIATTLRGHYDDLERMERRVMASALDWTIVRPVGLSDAEATGHYRVTRDGSIPAKPGRIARADVAALMLKSLETDTYARRTVVIAG